MSISNHHAAARDAACEARLPANCIVQGDCNAILETLPRESVDFVLTDPPYGVRYRDRSGRTVANDDSLAPVLQAFRALYRVLKPDRFCVSFYGWNRVGEVLRASTARGFYPGGPLVWQKAYASSERFLQARHEQAYLLAKGRPPLPAQPLPDVLPWKYTGNRRHPTEKAVSILRPLVQCFSQPGELVL